MLRMRFLATRNRRVDRYRRTSCFEPLEERRLLAMTANYLMVAAPDSVAAEGTDGNTGAWRIIRTGFEEKWSENGVEIRRNNDHDCSTGDNPPPDSMISTANVNEDDLIRVDVNITPSIPGLTYSVQRNSSALKFWKNRSKSGGEHEFDINTLSLTTDGVLWAEYTTAESDNYTLTLIVEETASGMVLTTQSMTFRPFDSVTCAFVGELQTPGPDFSESGINRWVVDQLKNGYDVHVWDDGFDPSLDPDYTPDCAADGSGRAFAEIVNAVENRGVTHVAIVGFSHGGGSVYNLSNALSQVFWSGEGRNPYIPVFTSYIDAVMNEFVSNTVPEIRRPMNSLFHLNQYETDSFIHGGETLNGTSVNTENILRQDLSHTEMDDDELVRAYLTMRFCGKVTR